MSPRLYRLACLAAALLLLAALASTVAYHPQPFHPQPFHPQFISQMDTPNPNPLYDLSVPLSRIIPGATDAPTYGVTMLVSPPAAGLTYEQLAQEAQARAQVLGTQYGVTVSADWFPAMGEKPAFTAYAMGVYDLSAASRDEPNGRPLGARILENTPEACLAALNKELRNIEQLVLDEADPSLFVGKQLASFRALQAQEAFA